MIAKISRGFDAIATNDDLTLKISSKNLTNVPAYKLYELIVHDSFLRNKEFEVTQVLKGLDNDHAYVIAASPEQKNKILRLSIAVDSELIAPTPTQAKLMAAAIAKKNCLVLIVKNLNKGTSAAQVELSLKTLIGEKNVISVYFLRAEGGMHTGVANVEFLNAPIYKKFVNKTHKLQSKYVRFNPHPRSLDGIATPTEEMLREWGFHDLNTTLANTVEAMENATVTTPKQRSTAKGELSTMVKDAIATEAQTLK